MAQHPTGSDDLAGSAVEPGAGPGRDWLAVAMGGFRAASGVSFLVAPHTANRWWGDDAAPDTTASLLLRSMGYRDALVGGMLAWHGWRGSGATGWYLASAGADASDLLGGVANHHRMTERQVAIGLRSAAFGIGAGLAGAAYSRWRERR